MGEIIKLTLALTIVTVISGLAVGMANIRTKDQIAEKELSAKREAVEAVFPAGVEITEMNDKGGGVVPDKYWVGFSNDTIVGYAFVLSDRGYDAMDIKFMAGVGLDGKILGITIVSHNETPGLGDRVSEVASGKYIWNPLVKTEKAKPWFTEQFEGLSSLKPITIDKTIGEWHNLDDDAKSSLKHKNAVTAISGSTITTKAFTRAIEQKLSAYLKELGGYCCPETRKKAEALASSEEASEEGAGAGKDDKK
jgi:electron transport complex protein RnfG